MDQQQRQKIKALSHCRFSAGGYAKRFVGNMTSKPDEYTLSNKQATYLDKLHWQYRNQIWAKIDGGYDLLDPEVSDPVVNRKRSL